MSEKIKTYLVWGVLVAIILLPRLALLANGLDSNRIWDTNTPGTFRFLEAVQSGELKKFFSSDQKYPLLGSYLYVPVVGAYYVTGYLSGRFQSPSDFIDAFARGETSLFFWLRLEVLVLHLVGLALLFLLTKRFTDNSLRAGLYALLFAAVDFYVAMFSVTPRIHSLVFVGTIVTLYTSLRLLEEKNLRNYLLAFGAAGVAASISQSGFPAFILPLLAHTMDIKKIRFSFDHDRRPFLYGIVLFFVIVLSLGYPRFWFALWKGGTVASVLLSGEHSQPLFDLRHAFLFRVEFFIGASTVLLWTMFHGFWYVICSRKKDRIRLLPPDILAIGHIVIFALIFSLSDVVSGRFMLAVLPSMFFLCARIAHALESRRAFVYVLAALFAIQAYGIGLLTTVAFGGDTRQQAAVYVLANTNENDRILSTLDTELIGIVPAPHSISDNDSGAIAMRIKTRDLYGEKTRQIEQWRPGGTSIEETALGSYRLVIVSSDDPERYLAEEKLLRNNFRPTATFFSIREENPRIKSFVAWDMIAPAPRIPYPFKLRAFRAMGPTVVVYEKK